MNKTMKKIVAIVCTIIMAVSGLTLTPGKVTAADDEYTTCILNTNVSLGAWCYYVGDWAGASATYKGGETLDDFSMKILTNNHNEWGVQLYTYNIPVTAGIEYEYSITLNSDTAGASVLLKEDSGIGDLQRMTLAEGDNVFEGSFTADDDAVKMFFKLDMLTPGTTINVTSFSLEATTVIAPSDVEVYNFYASESGYRIDFTEVADAISYNVYIDDSSVIAGISETGEYVDADVFANYADNELHSVYLKAVDADGNESVRSNKTKVRITTLTNSDEDPADITRIYVVTNEGTKGGADITKAYKTESSLTIISGDSVINTSSDSGTIKRRGNSTSLADKPAYNISFSSKKEVIEGASKGKKWSLLANAYDKTMMRSKLAMDFGHVLGNVATPLQYYADLYIDGEYQGTYLISEPADNKRAGVKMDDSDDGIDIMFEFEADRVESDQTYYTTGLGVRLVTNEPEGLDENTDRYTYWVNTLSRFENALKNTSSDAVFDYIDMESFVDMYIANELFKTVDFGYSSVKYYITYDTNNNPTLHAGTLWDFDLSSGNCTNESIRSYKGLRGQEVNAWFGYLMKHETFKNAVIEKFAEYQPQIQNIYSDNELGDSRIDRLLDIMGASKDRNYTSADKGGAGWSESEVDSAEWNIYPYSYGTIEPFNKYTYDEHVEFLTDWLYKRNVWLCETWGVEYDYEVEETTTEIPTTEEATTEKKTTEAVTTEETTSEEPTTTSVETTTQGIAGTTTESTAETTTVTKIETTTVVPTTAKQDQETVTQTETAALELTKPPRMKIKKVSVKKKSSKKIKISLKKLKGAVGYQVAIYKTKKNAKKNKKALVKKIVKKRKFTIKSKKLKNKKKLFVRARAYVFDANGKKNYGKWSKIKKVKIKTNR